MLSRKCFRSLNTIRNCFSGVNNLYIRRYSKNPEDKNDIDHILGDIGSKYKVFRDTDSNEINDIYEEKFKNLNLWDNEESVDPLFGLNLERGVNGVFEIEDLIDVLKRENAEDVFVAAVPENVKYVNYMCFVTGKSQRHMRAIAQYVRRVYKHKRGKNDIVPRLEGEDSKEWMALDLGNIALHIFSPEGRKKYDLDMFWAVGPKFDNETNKEDPIVEMLEKHSIYLGDLEPAR